MNDTFSLTLESPLTEEQLNLITDAELEHTDRIWFDTPKGKHIEFVKAPQWIPCSERLPERVEPVLVTGIYGAVFIAIRKYEPIYEDYVWWHAEHGKVQVKAWMPLPEPYRRAADEQAD